MVHKSEQPPRGGLPCGWLLDAARRPVSRLSASGRSRRQMVRPGGMIQAGLHMNVDRVALIPKTVVPAHSPSMGRAGKVRRWILGQAVVTGPRRGVDAVAGACLAEHVGHMRSDGLL
jgi:hypothetical protein